MLVTVIGHVIIKKKESGVKQDNRSLTLSFRKDAAAIILLRPFSVITTESAAILYIMYFFSSSVSLREIAIISYTLDNLTGSMMKSGQMLKQT